MLAGLPLQNLYLLPFLCIPGLSYLCSNIDVSKRNFIWIRWDRKEMLYGICKLKCVGGHGLKIAVDFNQALIEKLAECLQKKIAKNGWRRGDPNTYEPFLPQSPWSPTLALGYVKEFKFQEPHKEIC